MYNDNSVISGVQSNPNYMATGLPSKSPMKDYPIYASNYYTGSDISIYFGDTWVDEITAIQFQIDEKTAAIYGYADYIYSNMMIGNRIVQGKFRINFTEAGYLDAIITRLLTTKLTSLPTVVSRESNTIESQTISNDSFESFAKKQEDAIWGELENDNYSNEQIHNSSLAEYTFDIVIGYGAKSGNKSVVSGYNAPSNTLQIIKNARIVGRAQIIDTSDNIIQEEYSFVAQDIVTTI